MFAKHQQAYSCFESEFGWKSRQVWVASMNCAYFKLQCNLFAWRVLCACLNAVVQGVILHVIYYILEIIVSKNNC
jgi:hypothetical protein